MKKDYLTLESFILLRDAIQSCSGASPYKTYDSEKVTKAKELLEKMGGGDGNRIER